MHKIDSPGATAGNEFQDKDIAGGVPGTLLWAKYQNTVQRELVNAVEGAGLVLDEMDDGQLLQAMERLRGAAVNEVVNGTFDVWQRGESITLVGSQQKYTADRWLAKTSSTLGVVITREAVGDADLDLPGGVGSYLRAANLAAGTGTITLSTHLEEIRAFQGRTMTLSVDLRSTSSSPVTLRVVQDFGTGGSPDVVVLDESGIATSTSFARVQRTLTLPSVSGKTIGADSHLRIQIESGGAGFVDIDAAAVQWQEGEFASDFAARPAGLERLLCLRYYQKSNPPDISWGTPSDEGLVTVGDTGPALWNMNQRLVPMYGTPAVRWASPAGALDKVDVGGADESVTGIVGESPTTTGYPTIAPSSAYGLIRGHFEAEAEVVPE